MDCKRLIIFIRKSPRERELELLEMSVSAEDFFYFSFLRCHNVTHVRDEFWCACEPEHHWEKGYRMDKTEITRCIYATCSTLSAFTFKEIQRMSSIFYSELETTMQWSADRYAETDTQSKQRNGEHLLADTTGYDANRSCRIFFTLRFISFEL